MAGICVEATTQKIQFAFAHALALEGGLAQLARALALQARGQGFESLILHITNKKKTEKLSLTCLKRGIDSD